MQLKATSSGNDDKENERDMDVFSFLFPCGSSDNDSDIVATFLLLFW